MSEKTLLVVGPQPPPVGGGTASVQMFLDELEGRKDVRTIAIDSSPRYQKKKTSLIKLGTLRRAVRIAKQFHRAIGRSDAVLVFASNGFIFSLGSLLLLMARLNRVPFYLKPLGGNLNLFLEAGNKWTRGYRRRVMRAATGVLVQTGQLRKELEKLSYTNVHYVPGYRPAATGSVRRKRNGDKFRVVFLSQIMREKGPLLLLEALRILGTDGGVDLECDFYGPILEEDRREFFAQLASTPGARYCGIAQVGTTSRVMAQYDVLAFPTHFIGEGHPGVILEAMQAGIPVISTDFRSIPELITDGENGILIPVGDSRALTSAIQRLALNPGLREKMGQANYRRSQEFRSDKIVSLIIEIILPAVAGQERNGECPPKLGLKKKRRSGARLPF